MATRNPSLNNLRSPDGNSRLSSADDAELHGPRGTWWWTGKEPKDTPGFVDGVLRALPLPSLQVLNFNDELNATLCQCSTETQLQLPKNTLLTGVNLCACAELHSSASVGLL